MKLNAQWAATLGAALVFGVVHAAPRSLPEPHAAPVDAGRDLIGTRPPEWQFEQWLQSKPLTLANLKGKVVLVRWWTAPQCPFCAASADALESFWKQYRDRGLVVIGAYHHKADTSLTMAHVKAQAERLGFTFPIAIDRDWKTLHKWWLDHEDRGWTSVTFLIDREGRIRHIHGGGAYYEGEAGYTALEKEIAVAVAQPAEPSADK